MRRFRRKQKNEDFIEGEIIEEPSEPQPSRQKDLADSEALERVAPDIPTPDEMVITQFTRRETKSETKKRRFRLPPLLLWHEIRPGLLLLASGLVMGGIFWTLHNLGRVPENYQGSWTVVLVIFSLLWALLSLVTRRAGAFLAATTLTGISLSLLLDAQGYVAWHDTLIGIVLITIGLGIIARGLVMRQGTIAR